VSDRTLLVATDGSPASEAAVDVALDLASTMAGRVRFVHAESRLARALFEHSPADGPSQEEIVAADPVLAAAVGRAAAMGVEAEVEVTSEEGGSAGLAAIIAGIANGIGASMIVTGSRGRGTVTGAVLGSVSHHLVADADVPVLIVHERRR
jgi:nucleotide-binding universal stress UspA family protein